MESFDPPKVIVIAGKVGSGKSTVLNSLYGLKLVAKSSPRPVTTTISEHHIEKEGETFIVLDTPGLGSISRSTKSIIGEVAKFVRDKDFTLLYCLPVKPSDTLTESDICTIKTIDSLLGRRVWDKCVLLLTFSDVAIIEFGSDTNAYTSYLQSHVIAFHDQFRKCGIVLPPIQMVTTHNKLVELGVVLLPLSTMTSDVAPRDDILLESTGQIIAVPVKDEQDRQYRIGSAIQPVKGVDHAQDWVDRALHVITYTSRLTKRMEPLKWYDIVRQNPLLCISGTLVGAGLGTAVGSVNGPLGSIIGTFVGASLGMVVTIAAVHKLRSIWASVNRRKRGH